MARRKQIDLLCNSGSCDFRVLLGLLFDCFRGGDTRESILLPRKQSKIGQNNPKNRRTLGCTRGLIFLALLLGLCACGKTAHQSFAVKEISSSLPPHEKWETSPPDEKMQEQLLKIFSEPLKFLGEGAQSYAFVSADGKYVVKFFKMRRFTPSFADLLCPHVVRRRLRNLNWVFNGYKAAYDHFRLDTGLVFIHLAKTQGLNLNAILLDEKGKPCTINLDSTEFVVQEKAEHLFVYLRKLYLEGKEKEARAAIAEVFKLIERRIALGYADRDKGVSFNYGFVNGRAIHLDVGRLYKGTKTGQLEHVQKRIERWQKENQVGSDKVM